jgi:glutathione S-transferase
MITPIFWGLVRTPAEKRDMKAIQAAIERGYKVWGMLDKHLAGRKYVAGEHFTTGDIPIGVHAFRWFTLVKDRPSMPNFEAWYDRLCQRPAYKEHCMNPLT